MSWSCVLVLTRMSLNKTIRNQAQDSCTFSILTHADVQVKGFTNIFATGDAVDVDDDHVAYLAVEHGKIAAKAIATLTKKPDGKLPTWKRSNGLRMTITTLGKKNAMANIGSETVFTWVPGTLPMVALFHT